MKKISSIIAMLLVAFAFASPVLAVDNESTPGTGYTVTDGLDPANTLTLNFSPAVVGQYLTDAVQTAGNKQWFSIGTFHGGGTMFYATSSDQTVVWKKARTTDQTLDDAAIPETLTVVDVEVEGVLTTPEVWAGWTK
jgi:hypothetical protein